ncbi:MAG: hypothetical protein AAF604_19600 [Acidobacteriota bacterium]
MIKRPILLLAFILMVSWPAAPPSDGAPFIELRNLDPTDSTAALGVGHLRLADLSFLKRGDWSRHPDSGAGWIQRLDLPLYNAPGGLPWRSLSRGRLQPATASDEAIAMATVTTAYGYASIPVLEMRADGWFRFGPMQPAPLADGTAWARRQDLDQHFVLEPYGDLLLQHPDPLYFRSARAGSLHPSPGGPVVDRVRGSHDIHPLELRGPWMKVRVIRPAIACDPDPPQQEPRTAVGWIRWRDATGNPTVWFPAKGC